MSTQETTNTIYSAKALKESSPDLYKKELESFQNQSLDYGWYDSSLEYFKEVCSSFGLEIDKISFSGFWSQGDGASFTGSYKYKKDWKKVFLKDFTKNNPFFKYAENLQKLQKKSFYSLTSTISQSGLYVHENTMSCNSWNTLYDYEASVQEEDDLLDCFRDIAREFYSQLENEYEYLLSEEAFLEGDNNFKISEEDGELVSESL